LHQHRLTHSEVLVNATLYPRWSGSNRNKRFFSNPRIDGDHIANSHTTDRLRRQSQHSSIAKAVTMSNLAASATITTNKESNNGSDQGIISPSSLAPPAPRSLSRAFQGVANAQHAPSEVIGANSHTSSVASGPPTAPGSPRM
jgi:hypothetical protein